MRGSTQPTAGLFRSWQCLLLSALVVLLCGCEQELASVNPRERAELEKIFLDARKLDELGRYHEALVRYETILARHPEFISTRLNAAMAAYDSGQYQKAFDHFEIIHKAGPQDWFVIRKLIQCAERLKRPDLVDKYRAKLERLRQMKDATPILKQYAGLTRDYIPIGTMHLIGYEFFEPKKHGKLWLFRLEDRDNAPVCTFLLEATPFHDESGRRIFCLTEANRGWLKIWHVGIEGREYGWTRDRVLECLQGKRQPLVTRPLPAGYQTIEAKVEEPAAPPRPREPGGSDRPLSPEARSKFVE